MRVFQTDDDGFFLFETTADPDPLVIDRYLIPRGCVLIPPPACGPDEWPRWTGCDGEWERYTIPRTRAYRFGKFIRSLLGARR
jgi:hypothetical protein